MLCFAFNDFRNQDSGPGQNHNRQDNRNQRGPLPPGLGGGGIILALLFVLGFAVLLGVYKGVENISAMDIFLMAAVAFVVTRLVRRNAGKEEPGGQNQFPDKNRFREQNRNRFQSEDDERREEEEAEAYWRRREEEESRSGAERDVHPPAGKTPDYDPWDRYRSLPEDGGQAPPAASQVGRAAPQGFDRREFVAGAKVLFAKIQEAVAAKDLGPVQSFLTERAAAELNQELAHRAEPRSCTVLSVEAAVSDIREQGEATEVSVAYDAVVHFGNDEAPREIKAAWRFRRDNADASWQLDSVSA